MKGIGLRDYWLNFVSSSSCKYLRIFSIVFGILIWSDGDASYKNIVSFVSHIFRQGLDTLRLLGQLEALLCDKICQYNGFLFVILLIFSLLFYLYVNNIWCTSLWRTSAWKMEGSSWNSIVQRERLFWTVHKKELHSKQVNKVTMIIVFCSFCCQNKWINRKEKMLTFMNC